MSEYSEKHTVSRLFGAPPGYVGYEEGGQLTEKVRRRPFSVVLFDEVEKAHADLFNSLLQILEDGRLTDSQGRVVDFKNTVIIMTTNLGTRDISKSVATGFQSGTDTQTGYNRMRARVTEELKQHFRPEFLNRVDDVVVFPQLTQDEIIEIVDMFVGRLEKRLKDKDMGIELTTAAKVLLATRGYDPAMGARPLRRTIQREIEDQLSEKILFGELHAGDIVVVDVDGEGDDAKFTFAGNAKPRIPEIAPSSKPRQQRPARSPKEQAGPLPCPGPRPCHAPARSAQDTRPSAIHHRHVHEPHYHLVPAPDGDEDCYSIGFYCADSDAPIARAERIGATVREPLSTFVSGDRFASIRDH
ncbi:ATP-dependent Clp protease ATP-binding subunit ClpC1 [Arthrobacter sp. Hiyo4]|nr:ATP-dependent Clp protease ATP-binding subunit ClpC1 [Arthrobacter sp. Hiyo4]